MYSGSTEFNNLIEKSGGNALITRFKFSNFTLTQFIKLDYYGGSNNSDDIAIGTTNMAYLDVSTITDKIITNQEFLFEVGVELSDGTIEYAPMGYFKVQSPDSDEDAVNFKAYDRMQKFEKPYISSLTYPTNSSQILNELCTKCGVELVTPIGSAITITDKLEGYTCREVLGYIAGIHGKFACFDRYGKLNLRWYNPTPIEKQIGLIWSLTKSQSDYKVEKITLAKDAETTYTSGTGISGINHSNPYATQAIANSIYRTFSNFTYRPCEISMLDDIRIDPWDMLKVTYLDGSVLTIPVMSLEHSFTSGETKVKSVGKTDTENEYNYSGPVTQAMDRMATELLVANRVIATKVDAEWVNAHTVTTDKLEATNARVETLEANSLTATEADLRYANITLANIDTANIDVAKIGLLFTKVGLIDRATIVDGHITGFLDAVEINANNITAGTLIADRILLKGSESGLLYALNNLGELTSTAVDTLDGTILTQRTVTADKLVANSITANELDVTNIFGNSAVLSTLVSQEAFINAISTNSIVVGAKNTANDALNAVNGLKIGGRNLFLRTKDLNKSVWKGTAIPTIDDDGFYYYKLRDTWYRYTYQDVNLDLGEYTCSFYAKADSVVTLEIKEDSANQVRLGLIDINSTDWKKYKATFNITKNTAVPQIAFLTRQNTSDIYIKKIKLEKGNKATDWTPAPEDTEDSISKVNTKAQGIIDNIYTPNTTTIDGGKITTGSIKASSIDVNNLFAQNITATGSITGAKLYGVHIETTSGSIGGFTISNTQIYSDNGTDVKGATYDLSIKSYKNDSSTHNAILIRTRANTSASWTTKVRFRYDGTAYFGGNDSYVSITDGRIVIAQTTLDGTEVNMPRITFKGAYGVDNSSCNLVYAGNKSLNWNGNFLAKGDIGATGNIHSSGDISATNQLKAKSIELSAETSFIDFHYNSSTKDYTSRIRESAAGVFTFQCDSIRMSPMTSGGTPMFRSASGACQFGASSDSYVCYISGSEVRVCNTSRSAYNVIKASAFTNQSSKRLKMNVEKMTDEEADKIYDLDVVTFDYINGEKNQRGLIAEDVYNIIPSMVQGDVYADDDDYEAIMGIGIDYSKAVPYIIKAIQTMRKELDEIKATQ